MKAGLDQSLLASYFQVSQNHINVIVAPGRWSPGASYTPHPLAFKQFTQTLSSGPLHSLFPMPGNTCPWFNSSLPSDLTWPLLSGTFPDPYATWQSLLSPPSTTLFLCFAFMGISDLHQAHWCPLTVPSTWTVSPPHLWSFLCLCVHSEITCFNLMLVL